MELWMTDKQVYDAFAEVEAYKDVDAFVSDVALSSDFEEYSDFSVMPQLCEALRRMWECYNYSFSEILDLMELSQTQFAKKFFIPLRTVQHWANEDREIPIYLKLLICEMFGLWNRKFFDDSIEQ